jgi:hypothetical protein
MKRLTVCPTPDGHIEPGRHTDLRGEIAAELYKALEHLDANSDLLALVGSYGETLDDETVLALLKEYNAGRPIIYPVH